MTTSALAPDLATPAWTVRPEQPIDLDAIHELHRSSFPTAEEAELVDAIRSGPHFVPELSLVAVTEDGSVIGHILVSRIGLAPDDDPAARIDVLALAPIAVLPPHQGRGIGSALMEEALAIADTRDEPLMAVVGAPTFYAGFGFVPADELEIRGPYEAAGDAFRVRPRPGIDDLPAGELIYPPPFPPA